MSGYHPVKRLGVENSYDSVFSSCLRVVDGQRRRRRVRLLIESHGRAHQGDGGDSEHVQRHLLAGRQAHRVPQQPDWPPHVWLVDTAGGEPQQITHGADPVGSLAWSPVGETIAYDVARGGGYNAQVFLSRSDGSGAKRITSGGKEDNFAGAFAPDGRYWFRSNQRNPSAGHLDLRPGDRRVAIAIKFERSAASTTSSGRETAR